MFSDLRFVIIDEMHHFMQDAKGLQLLCVLEILQRLMDVVPRRIELSATLVDLSLELSYFLEIPQKDYKQLLTHLINIEQLERTKR